MAHLIYLSISFANLYIWGQSVHLRPICTFEADCASNVQILCCAFEAESASNVQLSELSDWLRQITWENKLNLPQMYIHLRPICTFEAGSVHLRPNLKSASNVQLSDWLSEIGLKCTAVWLANSVCQPIRQLYIWGRFGLKCTESASNWKCSNL